ncbi:hypothetical protein [Streptacidiphilus cavernicola]|uniref:Transcriptional regulator n=1 Tax=Streptacidiphilus cavernicola TaxID=3342716 RepID=A0ABV6W234_9ACTN
MAEVLLKAILRTLDLSHEDFQAKYQAAAAELREITGDRRFDNVVLLPMTVWRWTNGAVGMPRQPAPRILERMFNVPAAELFAPCPDGLKWTGPKVEPVFDESELRMTAHDAAAHAGDAASRALPDLTLDQIEDDLRYLARAHVDTAPYVMYVQGRQVLQSATLMLDRTQLPSQRRRLYLVAGQCSALIAACATDLGQMPTAVELLRASALYGQVSEHGALQAYAHGYLAILAYMDGNPTQALRLVKKAHEFSGIGDTGRARLFAIEARAYGHLGRFDDAARAIQASLEQSSGRRDDVHDEVAGEFDFPLGRIAMSNSTTYLLMRDGAAAETTAMQSLSLIAEGGPAGATPVPIASKASSDLAMARLLRQDVDGAAEALRAVFELPREWRSPGLRDRVRTVRRELVSAAFRDAPGAIGMAEECEDFVQMAGPPSLGPGS